MAERALCLYRVSTTKQVDHDEQDRADISMQRKTCRKFAEKMGWTIVGEEQETGVSGYKVSANDRDKLQLIKERAEQGRFDILLVFMFDRLGRKSDETPFVVEWFCSGVIPFGRDGEVPSPNPLCASKNETSALRLFRFRRPVIPR